MTIDLTNKYYTLLSDIDDSAYLVLRDLCIDNDLAYAKWHPGEISVISDSVFDRDLSRSISRCETTDLVNAVSFSSFAAGDTVGTFSYSNSISHSLFYSHSASKSRTGSWTRSTRDQVTFLLGTSARASES